MRRINIHILLKCGKDARHNNFNNLLSVYNSFQLIKKYIRYYRTASNSKGHGMHSPFVFDFILHVLNNGKRYTAPPEIEKLRKEYLADKTVLEIEDLGAGSRIQSKRQKQVAKLAQTALKPKKYAQVLYRLIKHYQPKTIIELGTSLGITTAYLAAANPKANVITIEGSSSVMNVAKSGFKKLNLDHILALTGHFDQVLPTVLGQFATVDLVYIDGNHRYQPTINYFLQCLAKSGNDTILVFDDIHWSEEMEKAWEEIKAHPSVQYTIDIFFLGFVFFRNDFKVKQNFVIRF